MSSSWRTSARTSDGPEEGLRAAREATSIARMRIGLLLGSGGQSGDIGWARWPHVSVRSPTFPWQCAVNLRRKGRTALLTRTEEQQETRGGGGTPPHDATGGRARAAGRGLHHDPAPLPGGAADGRRAPSAAAASRRDVHRRRVQGDSRVDLHRTVHPTASRGQPHRRTHVVPTPSLTGISHGGLTPDHGTGLTLRSR